MADEIQYSRLKFIIGQPIILIIVFVFFFAIWLLNFVSIENLSSFSFNLKENWVSGITKIFGWMLGLLALYLTWDVIKKNNQAKKELLLKIKQDKSLLETLKSLKTEIDEFQRWEKLVKTISPKVAMLDASLQNSIWNGLRQDSVKGRIRYGNKLFEDIHIEAMEHVEKGRQHVIKNEQEESLKEAIAEAIKEADLAIKDDPCNPDAHYIRSLLYFSQNDVEKGKIELKKTINYQPDHALANLILKLFSDSPKEIKWSEKDVKKVFLLDDPHSSKAEADFRQLMKLKS